MGAVTGDSVTYLVAVGGYPEKHERSRGNECGLLDQSCWNAILDRLLVSRVAGPRLLLAPKQDQEGTNDD